MSDTIQISKVSNAFETITSSPQDGIHSITKTSQEIRDRGGLHYYAIESQIKFLLGDILTIIDAVTVDPEQRKAQKDLIKISFHKKLDHIKKLCFGDGASLASRD